MPFHAFFVDFFPPILLRSLRDDRARVATTVALLLLLLLLLLPRWWWLPHWLRHLLLTCGCALFHSSCHEHEAIELLVQHGALVLSVGAWHVSHLHHLEAARADECEQLVSREAHATRVPAVGAVELERPN